MFVTASQFYVFIACVSYGIVSGLLLVVVGVFKNIIKRSYIKAILDVLCFVLIGFGYAIYSYLLGFPNFRAYMFFGVILGIILSNKSFYFILAKCVKKIYNIIVKTKRKKRDAGKRI